jgi:hypothetical protein
VTALVDRTKLTGTPASRELSHFFIYTDNPTEAFELVKPAV